MASFKTACALGLKPIALPESAHVAEVAIDINWPDAGTIANGNVVELCELPPGVQIVDFAIHTDDIDTGTTAAATLAVLNSAGTGVGTTIQAGLTVFQAGGVARCAVNASKIDVATSLRKIGLVFTGAAAGALTGLRGLAVLKLRTI